jgi:hypothetical protein
MLHNKKKSAGGRRGKKGGSPKPLIRRGGKLLIA